MAHASTPADDVGMSSTDQIVFSNTAEFRTMALLMAAIPFGLTALALFAATPADPLTWSALPAAAVLYLPFFVTAGVLLWHSGRWIADAQGITFTGPLRRRRTIRWSEIKRIRWSRLSAVLDGEAGRMTINWQSIRPAKREPAPAFVGQQLARYFDTAIDPPVLLPIHWRRLAVATVFMAAPILLVTCIALNDPDRWFWLLPWVMQGILVAGLVIGFLLARQDLRKRLSPNRWRYRRAF